MRRVLLAQGKLCKAAGAQESCASAGFKPISGSGPPPGPPSAGPGAAAAGPLPSTTSSSVPPCCTRAVYFRILYSPQSYHRKKKLFQDGLLVLTVEGGPLGRDAEQEIQNPIVPQTTRIKKAELRNERGEPVRQFRGFTDRAMTLEGLRYLGKEDNLGYHSGMFLELGDEISEAEYLSGQLFLADPLPGTGGGGGGVLAMLGSRLPRPAVNLKRPAAAVSTRSLGGTKNAPGRADVEQKRAEEEDRAEDGTAAPRRVLLPLKKRKLLAAPTEIEMETDPGVDVAGRPRPAAQAAQELQCRCAVATEGTENTAAAREGSDQLVAVEKFAFNLPHNNDAAVDASALDGMHANSVSATTSSDDPMKQEGGAARDSTAFTSPTTDGASTSRQAATTLVLRVPRQPDVSISTRSVPPLVLGTADDPVPVDPALAASLRPHQIDALHFLYRTFFGTTSGQNANPPLSPTTPSQLAQAAPSTAYSGVLLADDMGLGKSLTTIAFLHTMLEARIFRKCCVVCPASLTNNWKREIQKWLASDGGKTQKLHPTCIVGNSHSKNLLKNQTGKDKMKFVIKAFLHGKTISDKLLILSYEQLRNHADELAAGIDFLVLDEGHRIGGGGSQTAAVLRKFSEGRNVAGSGYSSSLSGAGGANNKGSASSAMGQHRILLRGVARKCHDSSYPMRPTPKSVAMEGFPTKKLLLSGTPLQNNLDEFFALVDFLNPGCMGASEESFNQVFKKPILAGRAKQADDCARKLGAARFAYLNALTGPFLLRRTAGEVLKHLLPPMQTVVVWCGLGDEWTKKYCERISGGPAPAAPPALEVAPPTASTGSGSRTCTTTPATRCSNNSALQLMLDLRKICYESKMHFLKALLQTMARKKEKCVLVSNFTRCLDLVEGILCELALQGKGGLASFSYERLDGSTEQKARQPMVDRFNKPVAARTCSPSPENGDDTSEAHQLNPPVNFFLLSSKAGGVGLNLVGGSRLVMLDPDWNPANDAQAMRRVWRDGQKNEVFVYRLVVPGSIEECILCRQEKKEDLLHGVLSNGNGGGGGMKRKAGVTGLSLAEAKQVFQLRGYVLAATGSKRKGAKMLLDSGKIGSGAVEVDGASTKVNWRGSEYVLQQTAVEDGVLERSLLRTDDDLKTNVRVTMGTSALSVEADADHTEDGSACGDEQYQ